MDVWMDGHTQPWTQASPAGVLPGYTGIIQLCKDTGAPVPSQPWQGGFTLWGGSWALGFYQSFPGDFDGRPSPRTAGLGSGAVVL